MQGRERMQKPKHDVLKKNVQCVPLTEEKMAPGDVYGPAQKYFEEAFFSEL